MSKTRRPIAIEHVRPAVDDGRYPAKRIVGEALDVSADIFKEGHDLLAAAIRYRARDQADWRTAPLRPTDNDGWAGSFRLDANTRYRYTVEAWTDTFGSWVEEMRRRITGGQADLTSELLEGAELVRLAREAAGGADAAALGRTLERLAAASPRDGRLDVLLDPELRQVMARAQPRPDLTRYDRELEVVADRPEAGFAAWYELFPRSQGRIAGRHGTFEDCIERLPDVRRMGFDVVYLPPIHPIGRSARKGPDNALVAGPGDPGSPWAIGSADGGYTAVHPDLGTVEDFDRFVEAAHRLGLEVALDFAIQCSPDHPWVREHPEWFFHRPDGTIKYAENPPKKYQDIYPVNFQSEAAPALWEEMRQILEFWIGHGVSTFRVDNPHTKPVKFWEWLIRAIKDAHPDVVFLAEAFTRPKMMKVLAKSGFTQSYTYFTWRNTKQELTEYLTEITTPPVAEYFRGNLWPNTPDILHETLQRGGRPAFKTRLVLAATLSSLYGIYSGYELCENVPREPGSEEYVNSEKYEYKARDWNAPGNLVDYVTRINRIRRDNHALHASTNLRFYGADNPDILFYGKMTPERDNVVFVAVNLDPFATHACQVDVPIGELGIGAAQSYRVHELVSDAWYEWRGARNYVELHPNVEPAQIFVLHR
jgi:starch synthase (maltosyl-transferring)